MADAGYYSQAEEQAVEQKAVRWVAVPNRNTQKYRTEKERDQPMVQESAALAYGM
jgi:hypothetical protein